MEPGAADVLLFDLGGVVIDIDLERVFARWAEHAACDAALIRTRFCVNDAYRLHETGAISDNEYFASLRGLLGIDIADDQFLDGWNAIFIDEMPGIANLLARAGEALPLYAFSNTNPAHEAFWSGRFDDALKHFRTIFVSSTIGRRKPDAEAFEFVVGKIGVPAGRIVFFDDSAANVEAARGCGLQAVHVTSHTDVAHTLSTQFGIRA